MANYYASARSNYFKVKDKESFKTNFIDRLNLELIESGDLVGFLVNDDGGIPTVVYNENGDDIDIDFDALLASFLDEDSVAIYMESGAEKLRYISGYAVAVNSKGSIKTVTLDDIYEKAKELTSSKEDISCCTY